MEEYLSTSLVEETKSQNNAFKEAFKYYRNPKHCKSEAIFDSTVITPDRYAQHAVNKAIVSSTCVRKGLECPVALRPPDTWNVFRFKFPAGLIFIENPFTQEGQQYWVTRCLLEYPRHPHVTNIDNLGNVQRPPKDNEYSSESSESKDFYRKLRWVTFGYHHNWDTKIYSEPSKCPFPTDLAELTRFISIVLGFTDFEAQAAIVNYYHLDSTLSGHQDRSERNQDAPLFSISFGQTAVFLIGADTRDVPPVPIYLRSGDIVVMTGQSRLAYHGVPRILEASCSPWISTTKEDTTLNECSVRKKSKLDDDCTSDGDLVRKKVFTSVINQWNGFVSEYISKCRINLNVRQVLFQGETKIPSLR